MAIIARIGIVQSVLAVATVPIPALGQAEEYNVKAAFLYHFAQLVDWPPAAPGDPSQTLGLCTLGEDPFQGGLESTVNGKTVGSRVLRVRHLKKPEEARNCQILFIDRAEDKRLPDILSALGNVPVLTVGETDGFAQRGGMIEFCLDDNKIRFNINVAPADKVGLKISSKLLLLAKTVSGNRGGN